MTGTEFQISVNAFLAAQLAALRASKFCPPPPVNIGGRQIIVDHLEFAANNIRHDVPATYTVYFQDHGVEQSDDAAGFDVELAQPVTVVLTDLQDVLSRPNQQPNLMLPISATVVLRFDYFAAGDGQCWLKVDCRLEHGPLPPLPTGVDAKQLEEQFDKLVKGLFPSRVTPFDPARTLLPSSHAENAGMSVDVGLARLALREELGGSGPYAALVWSQFFKGHVDDHLQGEDWALFISESTLTYFFSTRVSQGLTDASAAEFQLVTGVGATYSNPGGKAHVTITFGGNVDLVVCTVWVDFRMECDISAETSNTLTFDAELFFEPATTLCTLPLVLISKILGVSMQSIVEAAVALFQGMGSLGLGDKLLGTDCKQVSVTHVVCSMTPTPAETPLLGTLAFDGAVGLDDGLSLLGRLESKSLTTPSIEAAVSSEFTYLPPDISCGEISGREGADFKADPTRYVSAEATVTIGNGGSAPLYICDVSVVNDPLGVFPKSSLSIETNREPYEITVHIPYPVSDYFESPYPCDLLIKTNGGTRLISIPALREITQQEIDKLAVKLAGRLGWCQKLVDDWFTHFRQFNPHWAVDPPPGSLVEHLWEFEVVGLAPGEHASLVDISGFPLVEAVASAGQSTLLTSLVTPAPKNELSLRRGSIASIPAASTVRSAGNNRDRGAREGPGIRCVQRLIVRLASIPLFRPCLRLTAAYLGGAPCVIVVLDGRCLAYDVSNPRLPRLTESFHVEGLQGVLPWRDGLLGFGEDGLGRLWPRIPGQETCECREIRPILDAVCGQDVIYALTDEGLEVHSNRLHRVFTESIAGARRLVRLGQMLLVAARGGLARYDLTNPRCPALTGRYYVTGVEELVIPPGGHGKTVTLAMRSGPARAMDFSGDAEPKVVATYEQAPWFMGAVWLPGLLAKVGQDRTLLHLSGFGKAKTF